MIASPAGELAHQVHRVHGGFGSRGGEPPQWKPEAAREAAAHRDQILGRLREMGSARHLASDRALMTGGMGVSDQRGPEPAVHVDVFVAVDVVQLGALPVAEPDGLRPRDLPA